MPILSDAISIDAPPHAVFRAFVTDASAVSRWWPALAQHTALAMTPRFVGSRLRYTYVIKGLRVRGQYEIVDFVPYTYLFVRTLSGIDAVLEMVMEPVRGSTHLELTAQYTLPGALLGSSMHRPAMEAQVEQDVSTFLQALKHGLEGAEKPVQKGSPPA